MSDGPARPGAEPTAARAELERRLLARRGPAAAGRIPRRPDGGPAPLSFAQQRLWFLEQLHPATALYNMARIIRLHGTLDRTVLQQSLDAIVARHEALRTRIVAVDGVPSQVVSPPAGASLTILDLAEVPDDRRAAEAERILDEQVRRPFDLSAGPLFRACLLRLAPQEHLLLLCMHHIISDGWSREILSRELTEFFRAYATGAPLELPALPIQYADYAVWQRGELQGERLERELSYWRERLRGAPTALELPADRPRPPIRSGRGARRRIRLPRAMAERLRAFSRRENVTLFTLLLAALQTLLARYSGQDDIVVGTPIAGRNRPETRDVIGFFVNTLVLRTSLAGDPTFRELLRRAREVTLGAYDHPDIPFEQLVDELQHQRDLSRPPVFQVLLALQNMPHHRLELPGLTLEVEAPATGTAKFDLTMACTEDGEELRLELEYSTDLFESETMDRLLGHFQQLLDGILADPDCRISALPLLSDEERRHLLVTWNAAATEYPREATLGELFQRQVALRPAADAVVFQDERVSYAELDARANRLAHHLRERGVPREGRVGICLERSADLVAALVGVVKAGATYVPLDPAYPPERLRYMLDDAGAAVVITDRRLAARFPAGLSADMVLLDAEREVIADRSHTPPGLEQHPDQLAYVMYTSGSTGRPKGVAVTHRGIVRLVCGTDFVQITPSDRVAQVCTVMFDVATWEIWGSLLNGATLVVIPREVILSPTELAAELRSRRITTIDLPTALFNELARETPDALRTVRDVQLGGEAADPLHVREILRHGAPGRLINSYGPCECTTTATWHEIREIGDDAPTVPIGRPIANTLVYVLDRHMELVPVGVPGELYIGGPGLARGYHGRPGLTAERFVPDPYAPEHEPGGRLYRTGDRVRWRPDGALEFLGRVDDQLKLRGHRIEPGEIEAALREHPGVREACVLARSDAGYGRQLVAYVVPAGGDPASDGYRRFLQQRLPDYMVPGRFVTLPALPRAPGGKVDRTALPAPREDRPDLEQEAVEPRSQLEEAIAGIWAGVLRLDRVGIYDDFFALGGHSLLVTQVLARVRALLGVELPVSAFFEAPTVAALGERIAARQPALPAGQPSPTPPTAPPTNQRRGPSPGAPTIRRRGEAGPAPLSFAQQRLWFLEQLYPGTPLHTISRLLRLDGTLDVAVLQRTLDAVVARHESLRTSFVSEGGVPVQLIAPAARIPVRTIDLSHLPASERDAEASRLVGETARHPFDLAQGPLFRALLLRLGDERHMLLLTMHHIVSDAWSLQVLSREITVLYRAFVEGAHAALPELPIQYADYAVWQRDWLRGERLERELAYWRERLGDAPASLELPTDRPRPEVQSTRGARESLVLPPDLTDELRALSRREGVTLFVIVLAALQALLARYTGQYDVVVGAPIAGRTHTETEELIGFFVNTLALRTDLSGDPTFRELVGRAREVTLGAYAHQHLPFEQLVEELQPERDMSRTPLFQVALALQNVPQYRLQLPGLALQSEPVDTGTAKFDLTLFVSEQDGGLALVLQYCADLFEARTAARVLRNFRTLLERAIADPECRLSRLPLLTSEERHRVLVDWNATAADYPRDATVGSLFRRQAARTPDAVALSMGDVRLTYRDLAARAGRLAGRLRRQGVGTETRVAICLERSVELIVGVLGIVLAGGTYVPLDPDDPPERLRLLLADAGADVMLGDSRQRARLPAGAVSTVVWLDEDPGDTTEPLDVADADGLACVMYTSGSTGAPKGVAVPHRAIARLVLGTSYYAGGTDEVFLQLAPLAFDASTFEIWGALLTGARLAIAPAGALGLDEIGRTVREEGVTTLWLTAGLFHLVVDRGLDDLRGVRQLLAGGDVLSVAHVARVRRDLPHCRVSNGYGPTESTTFATCHRVDGPELTANVPIGRPIANTRAYVLDGALEPVPVGVAGELYLGGDGLARGYLGKPALTAERFVPDPFAAQPGQRLYRTGDRVRWRPDGLLEFLGRTDEQIKLRGHRVEPGEIEAALRRHPDIRAAVVTAARDAAGDKRLVAYVVPEGDSLEPSRLRAFLRERLPEFMMPAAFVSLTELPLSPNGKVDRRALPQASPAQFAAGPRFVEPRTPLEETIAGIWSTLLQVERVGITDNFFELGGHSLMAAQVVSRILATVGVGLPLRAIFEAPTVAALAARLEAVREAEPGVRVPELVPQARRPYSADTVNNRRKT